MSTVFIAYNPKTMKIITSDNVYHLSKLIRQPHWRTSDQFKSMLYIFTKGTEHKLYISKVMHWVRNPPKNVSEYNKAMERAYNYPIKIFEEQGWSLATTMHIN